MDAAYGAERRASWVPDALWVRARARESGFARAPARNVVGYLTEGFTFD